MFFGTQCMYMFYSIYIPNLGTYPLNLLWLEVSPPSLGVLYLYLLKDEGCYIKYKRGEMTLRTSWGKSGQESSTCWSLTLSRRKKGRMESRWSYRKRGSICFLLDCMKTCAPKLKCFWWKRCASRNICSFWCVITPLTIIQYYVFISVPF